MVSLLGGSLFGNPLAGALGDKDDKEDKKSETAEEEDPEIAEARREAEERRNEKYRKMEEEREVMRQSIREKYGIKKKVPIEPSQDPALEGRLGRKKKTPEELAAEAQLAEQEAARSNSLFPRDMDDLSNRVQELPGKVMTSVSGIAEKCSLQ